MNRRKFINLSATALALFLYGCAGPVLQSEPTQQMQEIKGKFPKDRFVFSQTVLKHDLIPSVLPEMQWALDRMEAGVGYLRKVASALVENPQHNSSTLGSIGAVAEENFPIAFSDNTTALDVIQNLFKDISDNRVILWGMSMQGVPYLVGTINYPKYQVSTGWYMESQMHANADFPFGGPQREESGTTYSQYTDLQVALKVIHEYAHCQQGRQLLKLVVAEHGNDITSRNYDVNYVSSLIDTKAKGLIISMNGNPKVDRNQIRGEIAFNEAQANQISQLVLWAINKLNADKRVPGTEDDSYPVSSSSLYRTFLRAIVNDKNPYDSAWLSLHANWIR